MPACQVGSIWGLTQQSRVIWMRLYDLFAISKYPVSPQPHLSRLNLLMKAKKCVWKLWNNQISGPWYDFLGYNDEYGHTHIKQLWSRQICDLYTLLCSLTFKLSWSSTSRGREPQLMKIRKLKNLKTFEDFCLLIQLNSVATCSSMSHMGRYQLGTACTAPGLMCANYANLI